MTELRAAVHGQSPKVLIAEDEWAIADMIESTLVQGGYEVCGIARTVPDAVKLAQLHAPALGVFDMRLADGGRGTDIAQQLRHRSLGVLYATGNPMEVISAAAVTGVGYIAKPYRTQDLLRALRIVSDIFITGTTLLTYPRGFRLLRAPFAA